MKKPLLTGLTAIVLVSVFAGGLWASGVLPTGMDSPRGVVQARKAMMKAVKFSMGDIGKKFEAGAVGDIRANALAVEVMARVMPPLYRETYADAYTGKGKYYKGAPPADMEAASEALRAAAASLAAAAAKADKNAVAAAVGKMQQSCGACHKAFRGQF